MKATAEQINAAIATVSALTAVNEQNAAIIARALDRLDTTREKLSDDACALITKFARNVAACGFALDNGHDIAFRNVYAFPKIRDIIRAIESGRPGLVDQYSRAFVFNANLRKSKTLDNIEQNGVCLAIETEKRRAKDKTLHVAPSTIATQRSSSCYALHACGLAEYVNPSSKTGYIELKEHSMIPEIVKSYRVSK